MLNLSRYAVRWQQLQTFDGDRLDLVQLVAETDAGPFGEGVDSLVHALGFRFGDQLLAGRSH